MKTIIKVNVVVGKSKRKKGLHHLNLTLHIKFYLAFHAEGKNHGSGFTNVGSTKSGPHIFPATVPEGVITNCLQGIFRGDVVMM